MNTQVVGLIKNFVYSILANGLSMIISVFTIIVVPLLLDWESYGYWQLYMFYSSYVGFFQLGWSNGIYLRYGGAKYSELNEGLFQSQFFMLFVLQCVFAILIAGYSLVFVNDASKSFVIYMTALSMVLINMYFFLVYILQMTYRIKEYARIVTINRILYAITLAIAFVVGIRDFQSIIVIDLVSRFITLLYASNCCKEIIYHKITDCYFSFHEMVLNISVGGKLMLSTIAGLLIVGVVRIGIEYGWNIATFGKVSLTLSISQFFMVFINAVSVVLFPVLKRSNTEYLPGIYRNVRQILISFLFGLLILYYPLKEILLWLFPKYSESLCYMALIFPMLIYEGNMALLVNTYLKTLRKEKFMMQVNFVVVGVSVVITLFNVFIIKNIYLIVFSILLLLVTRCILSEIFLSNILHLNLHNNIKCESLLTIIFVLLMWSFDSWITMVCYMMAYVIYLFWKKKEFIDSVFFMKSLLKQNKN